MLDIVIQMYYSSFRLIIFFMHMRQVLSLSLPLSEVEQIKQTALKRGYASVSSYVKYLVNADKDLISEVELLKTVREAQKEYRNGKSIKANSIADLV